VVVASIPRSGDSFDDATLEKPPRIGAHARFADAEAFGELIERLRFVAQQQCAEESSGDGRQTIGLCRVAHTIDERRRCFVHPGSIQCVQYVVNVNRIGSWMLDGWTAGDGRWAMGDGRRKTKKGRRDNVAAASSELASA